jgi:hypothetical protein
MTHHQSATPAAPVGPGVGAGVVGTVVWARAGVIVNKKPTRVRKPSRKGLLRLVSR